MAENGNGNGGGSIKRPVTGVGLTISSITTGLGVILALLLVIQYRFSDIKTMIDARYAEMSQRMNEDRQWAQDKVKNFVTARELQLVEQGHDIRYKAIMDQINNVDEKVDDLKDQMKELQKRLNGDESGRKN